MSNITKAKLTKTVKKLIICKFKVLFKTTDNLKKNFRYKNLVPKTLRSNQVYKFSCETAQLFTQAKPTSYFAKNKKIFKWDFLTSVRDYMFACDHQTAWEGFPLLL